MIHNVYIYNVFAILCQGFPQLVARCRQVFTDRRDSDCKSPICQGIRNHQKSSEIIRVYHCTKYSCFKHLQTELAELLAFVWFFDFLYAFVVSCHSFKRSQIRWSIGIALLIFVQMLQGFLGHTQAVLYKCLGQDSN